MGPGSAGTQAWSARIARRWSALAEDVHRRFGAATPPPGAAGSYPAVQRLPAPALPFRSIATDRALDSSSSPVFASASTSTRSMPVQRAATPTPASRATAETPAGGGTPRVNVEELAERVYRRLCDELWLARERGG
jgi:hypothetical protein